MFEFSKRGVAAAATLLMALSACGGGGADDAAETGSGEDSAAAQPAAPEEIAVTISDTAFEMPETLEAEPVKLMITNDAKDPHRTFFAKLNEGVTPEKVQKTFAKDPEAVFPLITVAGSLDMTKPGETTEATIQFPEGTYLAVDPESDGPPPVGFFEVTAAAGDEVAVPEADWKIETGDFFFRVDEAAAGESLVEIANVGEQGHEVILGRPGKGEGSEAGFFLAPAPGGKMWVTLDLEPGEYELLCYFPDPKSGKPHIKLGMKQPLTVE
ncbi:MAG TPA: hypothetical protein VM784_04380 [Actinomycetota bacterium]|nr:hypothetical protein [Actinomycetota bacterium]